MSSKGTWYLHVLTVDNAGNATETISNGVTVSSPTIGSILKAGDWVTYPSSQGNIDCVVLYDSSSSYGVEIITMKSVENVKIGDDDDFTTAMNSYNNAIEILNEAASRYNNSTYSNRARCVGSIPNNINSQSGYNTTLAGNYKGKLRDTDENYLADWNQMNLLEIEIINKDYWLASRVVDEGYSDCRFNVRTVYAAGYLDYSDIIYIYDDYIGLESYDNGLRPVFKLNSNIKVTGGTGEEGSPYTLGT